MTTANKKDSKIIILIAVAATVLRFLLCKGLMVYFVAGTHYDDIMQISKAFSIADGNWLGQYGSMTLVKGVGYPLMVAILHFLKVPYLEGFHFLYITGSIIFAWAIYPLVKNRFLCLMAYLMVLFNPIAFSRDLTRYYRDVMYYTICMIFISATVGLLIRQKGKIAAAISGFSLAWCILCREDGQWLYIYIVCCVVAIYIYKAVRYKRFYKEFTKEIVCMILAYSVVVLPICYMNYSRYGVFTLDEYNSGFYADAYGAISRLHGEEGNTQVVIPYSEREKLYEHSPAFAELKPYLDGGDPRFEPWKIASDDYRTGYFSFNLRDAIAARGYYKDSQTTNRYLKQLADEVNMYCDTIAENAYSKRSTIVSRFYPEHIPDILKATFRGLGLTLGYTNVNCIPIQCEEDDKYLKVFEDFTNSTIAGNRYMETGEIIENYHLTGFARWMQRFMRVTIILYSIITPVMFVCAVAYLLFQSVMLFKKYTDEMFIKWLSGCSLLALFMLRCFMIGYVDATSYSAIDNPSYQSGSYVALWCFISLQAAVFLYEVIKIKTSKKQR